jgi:hypothetical protein
MFPNASITNYHELGELTIDVIFSPVWMLKSPKLLSVATVKVLQGPGSLLMPEAIPI